MEFTNFGNCKWKMKAFTDSEQQMDFENISGCLYDWDQEECDTNFFSIKKNGYHCPDRLPEGFTVTHTYTHTHAPHTHILPCYRCNSVQYIWIRLLYSPSRCDSDPDVRVPGSRAPRPVQGGDRHDAPGERKERLTGHVAHGQWDYKHIQCVSRGSQMDWWNAILFFRKSLQKKLHMLVTSKWSQSWFQWLINSGTHNLCFYFQINEEVHSGP